MSIFFKSTTETNQILIHDEPMIQDLDLGPGFRTWIWELDLGLGFGTGLGLDNSIPIFCHEAAADCVVVTL